MPNWVQTKLEVSGDPHLLDRLATQVSKPYTTEGYDFVNNQVSIFDNEGAFLLWNIVSPTDLDSYYERADVAQRIAKRNKPEETLENPMPVGEVIQEVVTALNEAVAENKVSLLDVADEFYQKMSVENSWYYWNLRNWGTKWELQGSTVFREPNRLTYEFASAWSPPMEALNKLAEQYPEVTMTLKCHDEGDMFAAEIHWADGEMTFETNLEINHYLFEELYGGCFACKHTDPDDDYAEAREQYKCPA